MDWIKKNIQIILLIITAISLFKIAFFGIGGNIDTDTYVSGSISTDTDINGYVRITNY